MSTLFDASDTLKGLKEFQRDTVDHVIDRFYGANPTKRFLVADETGLGKSIVARGVIARMIERLQDDPEINRIDVVYVCSNADLARQNLRRLDVLGDGGIGFGSRLSLLGMKVHDLTADPGTWRKPINLISFTPATSFETGRAAGTARERALLFVLLRESLSLHRSRRTAALRVLQGGVHTLRGMANRVDELETDFKQGGFDHTTAATFNREIRTAQPGARSLLDRFDGLVRQTVGRHRVPTDLKLEATTVIAGMRSVLAKAGINVLEPDLVILDEFQRFRDLLVGDTEAAELAHSLFDHPDARVLLLSATPFKPYSLAEEDGIEGGHRENFLETVRFLADQCPSLDVGALVADFDGLRDALTVGGKSSALTASIRRQLLQVMCRAERPERLLGAQVAERHLDAEPVSSTDLVNYVHLRRLADRVGAPLSIEYWKSAPHFANFMDGYQVKAKLDAALADPLGLDSLHEFLRALVSLDTVELAGYGELDLGNARLRQLAAETVNAGWQNLLWVPPTLPYLRPGPPYDAPLLANMTKRLIFSSWTATPTAVASLLSYEAARQIVGEGAREFANTPEAREAFAPRLTYRLTAGRPASMTTLALFWPMPQLAALADPLAAAGSNGRALSAAYAIDRVEAEVGRGLREAVYSASVGSPDGSGLADRPASEERWYWTKALRWSREFVLPGPIDDMVQDASLAIAGSDRNQDGGAESTALAQHVRLALVSDPPPGEAPRDLARVVTEIAMHSPANCAWRALNRLRGASSVSPAALWRAAAVLANGLRSMLNRWESTFVLDTLYPGMPHWQRVLKYCAAGNLQAVLDEYLFHLADAEGIQSLTEKDLHDLAATAADAMSLRAVTYRAFDPHRPAQTLPFPARFALRYGSGRESDERQRLSEVRQSFNSPFWPFVLATTSVGQEGIDFHWWCHSIVHWNTPANPVDFEQREGRVNRFRGHAIRRNIVARHASEILRDPRGNPWEAAYDIAAKGDRLGGLRPDWIYEGECRIDRCVMPYPLSTDVAKLEDVKAQLALYRLAFGQNRQEDLVELMRLRGLGAGAVELDRLRIDLTAPRRTPPESLT